MSQTKETKETKEAMEIAPEKPVQKVRLTLYAKDLRNVVKFRKGSSSPFAIVTQIFEDGNEAPVMLGKTET